MARTLRSAAYLPAQTQRPRGVAQAFEALGSRDPPDRRERLRQAFQYLRPLAGATSPAERVASAFGGKGSPAQLLHLAQWAARSFPVGLRRLARVVTSQFTPSVIRSRLSSSSPEPPRKSGDDEAKSKKPKQPKTPEEEEELRSQLAGTFNYAYTEEGAKRCLEWAKSAPEMALDIETYGKLKRDGLLYTRGKVRLISLHYGGETWLIDCDFVEDGLVTPILEEIKDKPKYLHNSLFDIPRMYRRFGVLLDCEIHDTMVASRVARAGEWERKKGKVIQKSHGLDECLERELGIEIPKDRKLKWDGPLHEEHLEYATDDVAHLKELYEALKEVLRKHHVEERYEAISSRLSDFIGAAVRGVPLDTGTLQPALDALEREKADLESRLNALAPEHPEGLEWVWGNTSKETSPDGKGRSGALRALSLLGVELSDLQDQTLLDHREDHELVHTLYLYRKKANTLSRYSRWIPDFYEEGRMYPQPKVAASVTGRVLYSDPNAQGIDKHRTNEFRRCVRAEDGRAIVKGDFAQQELRIAAYYSKDKNMLETFANGEDIYLQTAAKLVGKPVSKDYPARQVAKRATLGFLYGLGTEKYRQNVYKDTGGVSLLRRPTRIAKHSVPRSPSSIGGSRSTGQSTHGRPGVPWGGVAWSPPIRITSQSTPKGSMDRFSPPPGTSSTSP